MRITKKFIERVKKEGFVETRHYYYHYSKDNNTIEYIRNDGLDGLENTYFHELKLGENMKSVLDNMYRILDYYLKELENISFRGEIEDIVERYSSETYDLINKSSINNEHKKKLENLMNDEIIVLREYGICQLNLLDSLSYDEFKILSDKTSELKKEMLDLI